MIIAAIQSNKVHILKKFIISAHFQTLIVVMHNYIMILQCRHFFFTFEISCSFTTQKKTLYFKCQFPISLYFLV